MFRPRPYEYDSGISLAYDFGLLPMMMLRLHAFLGQTVMFLFTDSLQVPGHPQPMTGRLTISCNLFCLFLGWEKRAGSPGIYDPQQ